MSLRILHVISGIAPELGGPTSAVIGWTRALAARGVDVSLLATWEHQSAFGVARDLNAANVKTRLIGPATRPLIRHPDIQPALREAIPKADVVHVHAVWDEVQHQAARIARELGKPFVFTPHGMLDEWNMSNSRWKKRLYLRWRLRRDLRHAALLHFATELERRSASAVTGTATPAVVEPLGIDLSEFQSLPPAGQFRGRYPGLARHPIILFLGRIHPGKGLDYIVRALAAVRDPDARLAVVGPDPRGYRADIERMAAGCGVADRVVFTGMLSGADRIAALVDADLLCVPSDHENFGVSVVEALAAGTPVLVSEAVFLHPQITAAGVGAVVPREPAGLAREITRWLRDDAARRAAAGAARPWAKSQFDWNDIAGRWVEHYSRVAAAGAGAGRVPDRGTISQ